MLFFSDQYRGTDRPAAIRRPVDVFESLSVMDSVETAQDVVGTQESFSKDWNVPTNCQGQRCGRKEGRMWIRSWLQGKQTRIWLK